MLARNATSAGSNIVRADRRPAFHAATPRSQTFRNSGIQSSHISNAVYLWNGSQNSAGAISLKARYVSGGTVGTVSTENSGPKRLPRMSRPPDWESFDSGRRYV